MKNLVYIKSKKEEVEISKWEYEGLLSCKLWIFDKVTEEIKEESFLKDDLVFLVP